MTASKGFGKFTGNHSGVTYCNPSHSRVGPHRVHDVMQSVPTESAIAIPIPIFQSVPNTKYLETKQGKTK